MIASDPRSAEEFVHWYVGSKPKQFADDNARQISVILGLIENAKSIAREIVGLKKNGAAWKDRQRALLDANVALGRELARLVDDDATLGKQVEKYKLEGMTGTYGSMPKPSGDDFTADHQPQDTDAKRLPFAQAEPGGVGLETLLAVTLNAVHAGHFGLLDALGLLTHHPATLLKVEAGRLAVGAAADLCLFDLDRAWQIRADDLAGNSRNTPFDGRPVQGKVLGTWKAGRRVFG